MHQFSSQGSSTALNFTIAFSACLSASFNSLAPICSALCPFTAIKLACLVLLVRLVSFQFAFDIISSLNYSKVLSLIHLLKYPIATSLPVGEPPALLAGSTPWFCKYNLSFTRKSGISSP